MPLLSLRGFLPRGLALLLLVCSAAAAPPRAVVHPIPPRLPLIRSAGYVFLGTVMDVERLTPSQPNAVATMRITFRVEQAVQGVRAGQTLEIHEWAGLWLAGERYRKGERVALFLYHPSRVGLTSPVGGPLGRFAVDSAGQIILQPFQVPALSASPRWTARMRSKLRLSPQELIQVVRAARE